MTAASRAARISAAVALVLAAVWAFWPQTLGGGTTYVTTHGTSMEPRFHTGDLAAPVSTPPGLRAFQRLMAVDDLQRRYTQERLRELVAARSSEVTVFSAHDAAELAALTRR